MTSVESPGPRPGNEPGNGSLPPPATLAPGAVPYTGQSTPRTRRLIAGAAVVGLGAACVYTFLVDPNVASNPYPKCPLKALTNIDCPGCGGLRATHALLHGDILGAADHNLLALVLLPIMAFMFVRWVLAQFDVQIPSFRWPRSFTWIAPVAVLVFTVVRNLPVPGLSWLGSSIS